MRKLRIVLIAILIPILTIIAVLLLYPALIIAKFNKDLVRVSTVQISITDQDINIGLDIAVRNEAPFHKLLDSISYTVNFDTFQFVTGALKLDSVRAGAEFDSILLPVVLNITILQDAIRKLQNKDSIDLIIEFVAHYQWPIIHKVDVPIKIVRRMPPPNPPEIKLLSVDIEKFSFNEPIVDVSLQIINKNNFSLTVKDLEVYIDFEGLFTGEVHHLKLIKIKPNGNTTIDITAHVHELKTLKTVWQLLVLRNEINYNIKVKTKYVDESGKTEPIEVNITSAGSVQTKSKKEKRKEARAAKR
jgi:LEA14-like dessication related protein